MKTALNSLLAVISYFQAKDGSGCNIYLAYLGDFQPDDFINDDIKIESEEAEKKEGKESKKLAKK
jgi:hypothetical protein